MTRTYLATGAEEMIAVGERLAHELPHKAIVYLIGNLGAGKTTLTKGIVQGLGAAKAEEVSSPTFTLIHEYGDPVRVYHIDLYRLEEERQLAGLGLEEIFDHRAVVLVEWPDRFCRRLPDPDVTITIEDAGDGRKIRVDSRLPVTSIE